MTMHWFAGRTTEFHNIHIDTLVCLCSTLGVIDHLFVLGHPANRLRMVNLAVRSKLEALVVMRSLYGISITAQLCLALPAMEK